ncbi:MAG: HypC/HybG/HupF family hydrogenase formation chaperone [Deltaproteobacteria bacterium]|nr:HypC/HybG/HupF family hydrogenase formation chaperone [Deltaproteobacteria bacterium]
MCLAVPMRVIEIPNEGRGVVDLDGIRYEVDLSLTDDVHVGDYVIVHAGFAIEKLDAEEADARLVLFERMADEYRRGLGGEVRLMAPPARFGGPS